MSDALQSSPTAGGLTKLEAGILDFEDAWWAADGTKDAEIHARFGLTPPRYYQILNALLDREDALAHKPLLVRRLARLRASRQQSRSARHLTVRVGG
ncbi:DUF3263 domain-containing protein [Propioniciclava soli]|uniref:DUF3263 domain-containing protein n=1 Tax=Propioniciclava soli TaxID=2775081 RepID=A0ABZ3C8P1_9ACTN|nr:DUF3263 domain-containing protein [Propioniciclava soli]